MRRALVLAVLLGLMLGLKALKTDAPGAQDPLTLAAIGFVVLAAFTLAEVGSALSLPRVTGYILGGALLGPHVSNILSERVVGDMQMFNNLALGLIAVGAGLELDARQIARLWRTLLGTILVKVVLGVLAVGGAVYGGQLLLHSLDIEAGAPLLALALVLGTLSIGTSPAIALAVINESRAKGRLSDILLGAAVLKDLVVVVCLAVALAIARGLVAEGGEAHGSILGTLLWELGGSLGLGALVGIALIAYIRFVHAEMLLVVGGMILVGAWAARELHLELLLIFIAAGFVVRNFSKYEHELLHAVELAALPVFVVFFTIAGARVDLAVTWRILPLAAGIVFTRALVFMVAGRVGGALGHESQAVRRQAWLGYLPQAGVTLGLVQIAQKQLPAIADSIGATGMATVALNLAIGPIALGQALKRAGEVGRAAPVVAEPPVEPRASELPPDDPLAPRAALQGATQQALDEIGSEELGEQVRRLHSQLDALGRELFQGEIAPWGEQLADHTLAQLEPVSEDAPADEAEGPVATFDTEAKAERLSKQLDDYRDVLVSMTQSVAVPLGKSNSDAGSNDGWLLRCRKLLLRSRLKLRLASSQRNVPLAAAAYTALAGRLAHWLESRMSQWMREELRARAEIEKVLVLGTDIETARDRIRDRGAQLLTAWEADRRAVLREGFEELAQTLKFVGGPSLAVIQVDPAPAQARVAAVRQHLTDIPKHWIRVMGLAEAELAFARDVHRLRQTHERALNESVLDPAIKALGGVEHVLGGVETRLRAVRREAENTEQTPEEWSELVNRARESFDADELAILEGSAARFRASASMHGVALELRAGVDELSEEVELVSPRLDLSDHLDPQKVSSRRFRLRREARELLLRGLLPSSEHAMKQVSITVVDTADRLREAREIALAVLEAEDGAGAAVPRSATLEQLDRALARLESQRRELERDIASARDALEAQADRSFAQLFERSGLSEAGTERGRAWAMLDRIAARVLPVARRAAAVRGKVASLYRGAAGSQLTREVRARAPGRAFDAAAIREYRAYWETPVARQLPAEYARLFAPTAATEHRLFTAHRATLDTIVSDESAWLDGTPGNVLVSGLPASGRTSLLNVLELELRANRIIRPQPLEWRRSIGALAALSIELEVQPTLPRLQRALSTTRTTVLIDDLEQWLAPDPSGLEQLEKLLELVVRTRGRVFWVVTASTNTLALFEENVAVSQAFGRVVSLDPLEAEQMARAILGRHKVSGRDLSYPTSLATQVLARLQRSNDEEVFFGLLTRASGGNIGRAVALWARGAELDTLGQIRPHIDLGQALGFPFIGKMKPSEIAMLVQLVRFGPLTERELGAALGLPKAQAALRAHHLLSAGLVERERSGAPIRIVSSLRPGVIAGLEQIGAKP